MLTLEQPVHLPLDVGWPVVHALTSLTGWTNASSVAPAAFDVVTIVGGALTISAPGDGLNTESPAAHGIVYRAFPGYARDYKIGCWWSGVRPAEGTPCAAVDLTKPEGGLGMWEAFDLLQASGGDESVWLLGEVGDSNANFVVESSRLLTDAEKARYNDVQTRHWIELWVVGGRYWATLDGERLGVEASVPANLVGCTVHGVAIDNNQCTVTPKDLVAPFPRTPDVPAAYGPFVITKL